MNPSVLSAAAEVAEFLHESHGVPRDQAVRLAACAAMRIPAAGLGQDILTASAAAADIQEIKKVREAVSPWLWILSVVGFGMGVLNTRRIGKMFKDWRAKRRA